MKQSLSVRSEQQARQLQTTANNRSATSEVQSFVDNRPQTIAQRQLLNTIHASPQMIAQCKLAESIRNSPRMVAQRELSRSLQSPSLQLQAAPEEEMLQGKFDTVQLATKIKHETGTVPFGGHRFIVGKKMEAILDPEDPVTGSATTDVNYEWTRLMRVVYPSSGVIRGHLLNHDLGGYGVPENLYPISSIANSSHSEKVEQNVKKNLTESHKKSKKEINYSVTVKEAGHADRPYEQAAFQCAWTDQDGKLYSEAIESNLQTDSGWQGHSGKQQSPPKWRHGKRRGELDFANVKLGGKIEIDKTAANAELSLINETYDQARLKTTNTFATEEQMIGDAVEIMGEQLDALGDAIEHGGMDKREKNVTWDSGVNFFHEFRSVYWKACWAKDYSAFTVDKWKEIGAMLDKITNERLYIEHGID